jgi:pyridoxal 5'-phosphate synthase pdxT subunit
MYKPVIGLLALQGDFAAHGRTLDQIGVNHIEIRLAEQLSQVQGLIIPGGESTTLIKLLKAFNLIEPIKNFYDKGGSVFGTCAGSILVAKHIQNSDQFRFGFIDITVIRNGYGRQADSFENDITINVPQPEHYHAVFIRAPKIISCGKNVTILSSTDDHILAAQQERILVTAFHPELTDDPRIHKYFVEHIVNQKKQESLY